MTTLHQLNNSNQLTSCLKLLSEKDKLLLIEAAVALVVKTDFLQQLPTGVKVFALTKDLQARGLLALCPAEIKPLSDSEWVAASLEAYRVCSW